MSESISDPANLRNAGSPAISEAGSRPATVFPARASDGHINFNLQTICGKGEQIDCQSDIFVMLARPCGTLP
jgi:hypothetical protein